MLRSRKFNTGIDLMKCRFCRREATRWYIHKKKWIDCCMIHYEAFLRKEQPLLYPRNQRKDTHPALQILICILFGALIAYTCVGTI